MSDIRSPLAKARDDWFESEEGKACSSGVTDGHYLHNRLERAFLAGANWASKQNTTHYESALKEAKVALDACHAHTVHGEVMTRDECHLCKTLATINKVLGPPHHD